MLPPSSHRPRVASDACANIVDFAAALTCCSRLAAWHAESTVQLDWLRAADLLPLFPPAAATSYAGRVAGSRWHRCLAGFFSNCLRERFVHRCLLRCSSIQPALRHCQPMRTPSRPARLGPGVPRNPDAGPEHRGYTIVQPSVDCLGRRASRRAAPTILRPPGLQQAVDPDTRFEVIAASGPPEG